MEEKLTKKCPYCGKDVLAVAKKCKYCGQWIEESLGANTDVLSSRKTVNIANKQPNKTRRNIFLSVLLVILLFVVGYYLARPSIGEHYLKQAQAEDSIGNYKSALALYEKAAQYNNAEAEFNLAKLYYNERADTLNEELSFQYFIKSYEHGKLEAAHAIGDFYERGIGTEKNIKKAIEYYKKPAGEWTSSSKYNLATILLKGDTVEGITKDIQSAVTLMKELADDGYEDAENMYGILLFNGYKELKGYIEQDKVAGISYLKKAADKGNRSAIRNLKDIYLHDNESRDIYKSLEYTKMLAESGDGESCAFMIKVSIEIDEDYEKAYSWAEKGYELKDAECVYWLAYFNILGKGTPKNVGKGYKLMQEAAEAGNEMAIEALSHFKSF